MDYRALGSTGLKVSAVGIGTYRMTDQVPPHRDALVMALQAGVNLIDTSSNYTNGGAEILIGDVVYDLIQKNELKRDDLVVVTKGGYIQEETLDFIRERRRKEQPISDVVEVSEGLSHCIHPDFLKTQLDQSLDRLKMDYADVYLLHNPEYYLTVAKRDDVSRQEAWQEVYRRIKDAFIYLESEVAAGRIKYYGVSSNTFPIAGSDYEFISLQKLCSIARSIREDHHFRVIQLPCNLLEHGAITMLNQNNAQLSVLNLARQLDIGVLINRPLNAFNGERLFRLVDFEVGQPVDRSEVEESILTLVQREGLFWGFLEPKLEMEQQEKDQVKGLFGMGQELQDYGFQFQGFEHFNEVLSTYFLPRLEYGVAVLTEMKLLEGDVKEWLQVYMQHMRDAAQLLSDYYKLEAEDEKQTVRDAVERTDGDWASVPTLGHMALRALRSTSGVSSVLVGMRSDAYVRDILSELVNDVPVIDRYDSWTTLANNLSSDL